MKLKLTTTYEDIDLCWLKMWLIKCDPNYSISLKGKLTESFPFEKVSWMTGVKETVKIELEEQEAPIGTASRGSN